MAADPAMSAPAASSSIRFARAARWVLAITVLVIVWGALVRATGAGAGCGNHWPLCDGEVVPRPESVESLIEYTHRLTSGIALLAVVALALWARRAFPAGHGVRAATAWSTLFMLGEAAIGAGIVLLELVADNSSMARAWWMAAHLCNTFLLLASLTLVVYFATGGAPLRPDADGRLRRLLLASFAGAFLIGISGSIAALGDTLFPAGSVLQGLRQDLSPSAHLLVRLRTLHPLIAVSVSLLLLYLVSVVRALGRPAARRAATRLNLLVVLQLAVGSLNIVLLAPVVLQLAHLLIADLVWIALVLTAAHALADQRHAASTATPAALATA